MAIQFFGQFLLQNGIIDAKQLLEAVEFQESQNMRLGEFAVQKEYFSKVDADRTNQLQRSKDLKYGEAAIELGLLTDAKVNELIAEQRHNRLYFGEVVVKKGFATQEAVDAALQQFQAEQSQYDAAGINIPESVPMADVAAGLFDISQKLLLRIWGLQGKIGTIVADIQEVELPELAAEVRIKGSVTLRYIVGVPLDMAQRGARWVLHMDDVSRDICTDLTREFANVVCGNMMVRLSQEGKEIEIMPPQDVTSPARIDDGAAVSIQLVTPYGNAVVAVTYPT